MIDPVGMYVCVWGVGYVCVCVNCRTGNEMSIGVEKGRNNTEAGSTHTIPARATGHFQAKNESADLRKCSFVVASVLRRENNILPEVCFLEHTQSAHVLRSAPTFSPTELTGICASAVSGALHSQWGLPLLFHVHRREQFHRA